MVSGLRRGYPREIVSRSLLGDCLRSDHSTNICSLCIDLAAEKRPIRHRRGLGRPWNSAVARLGGDFRPQTDVLDSRDRKAVLATVAGEIRRVSPRSLSRLVASGELPVVRLSQRVVRVRPEDLAAYVASRLEGGPPVRHG